MLFTPIRMEREGGHKAEKGNKIKLGFLSIDT